MQKMNNKPSTSSNDLESLFFDAEVAMEDGQVCRDLVCTIHQEEVDYLQDVAELLLFLLLPKEEFRALGPRTLVRELLVNMVLKPLLDLVSDPDWLNQNIVWLYKDLAVKPELFLLAVRQSESLEELQATRESVSREINFLRANDSKGELDSSLKLQLNSLLQLRKSIDSRIHRLQSGSEGSDSIGLPAQVDWNQMIGPGLKLFVLPLDVVLKNNLALSYFIDYMASIGCQAYIFFYLNVEGWKVSAEQQLMTLDFEESAESSGATVAIESPDFKKKVSSAGHAGSEERSEAKRASLMENLREAAHTIYEEYLSDKASPRLRLNDDTIVKRLLFKVLFSRNSCMYFVREICTQLCLLFRFVRNRPTLSGFRKCSPPSLRSSTRMSAF